MRMGKGQLPRKGGGYVGFASRNIAWLLCVIYGCNIFWLTVFVDDEQRHIASEIVDYDVGEIMNAPVDQKRRQQIKAAASAELRLIRQILHTPVNDNDMNSTSGYVMGKFRKDKTNCLAPKYHAAQMYAQLLPTLHMYRNEVGFGESSKFVNIVSRARLLEPKFDSKVKCKKHKVHHNGVSPFRVCDFANLCVRDGRLFTLNKVDFTSMRLYTLPSQECTVKVLVPSDREQALQQVTAKVTVVGTPTIIFSMRGKHDRRNLLLTSLGLFDVVDSHFGELKSCEGLNMITNSTNSVYNSTSYDMGSYSTVMLQNGMNKGSQNDLWSTILPWFKQTHWVERPIMFLHEYGGTTCFKRAVIGAGGAYHPLIKASEDRHGDEDYLKRKYPRLHQRMLYIVPKYASFVSRRLGLSRVRHELTRHTALLLRNNCRRIVNEAEVADALAQLGYHVSIVDFNRMTMFDQVRMVRSTELMVGLSGGELDMSLFLNNTYSALVEMIPFNSTDDTHATWMLYAGVPYFAWRNTNPTKMGRNETLDSVVSSQEPQPFHSDQLVDILEIETLARTARAVIARRLGRRMHSRKGLGSIKDLTALDE
eukprot:CFRG1068T1